MKLNIQEIRKQPEGLHFEQALDLAADLRKRNQEILDVKDILAVGKVQYEDRLYFLDYQLSYTIVLASSRSMEPVELAESYPVTEVFMEGATNQLDQEVLDDDLVLPIENGEIDLAESVADNILLNIPIKVLTAEEEAGQGFVSGNDWQIMTEEEYQAQQAVKKEENSPFAGLQGLFNGDESMVLSKKRARHVIEEIIALFPDAKPSLDFTNHFELLVAVMLSAQTTDAAVNKATPGLFAAFPTPQAMSVATESEIASHISRLGLYRNKAKFLKKCAQQLLDDFDGQVPQTREELESLAGVGRKTANVVLSVGFGIPAFAVDTHVERICKHHDIVKKSATPLEVEKRVMDVLPPEEWLAAHQAMIYFGRAICHPKNPECDHYPQLYDFSNV